jgi:predicted RNA-binding Zn-ribbon protein involved in translation (DUF1610 family)
MRITKRPKHVIIQQVKIISYYSRYQCPTCKTIFEGASVGEHVIRFKCRCGQELIVTEHVTV